MEERRPARVYPMNTMKTNWTMIHLMKMTVIWKAMPRRAPKSNAPASRQITKLFNKLSAEGCLACQAQGYGWNKERKRCGGFAEVKC